MSVSFGQLVFRPGDVVSYFEMTMEEETSLQKGMNYRIRGRKSIFLMNKSKTAPYEDSVLENGRVIIYEGHDAPRREIFKNPKNVDQPSHTPSGKLTENGKFYEAAVDYKKGLRDPEVIHVYEKIKSGIWVYNGQFKLTDSWTETQNGRSVFKFKLEILDSIPNEIGTNDSIEHTRVIPQSVKLTVWKRDNARCVKCGSNVNLHFDHIIPYSKGGTSLDESNIQLLCQKHNLQKHDSIQ